jgi:hypothetical protein
MRREKNEKEIFLELQISEKE